MRDMAKNDIWHNISKDYGCIWTKLGGQVGCVTRRNRFNFGEDPNPDPDTRIIKFLRDSSPLRDGAKNDIA